MFLFIGLLSARKKLNTKQDYYVASNSVAPWLVGLSAVATNNSGYMFIGVIGYTYSQGIYAIILMLAWLFGDFIASLFVHKKFQQISQQSGQSSYVSVIESWHKWHAPKFRLVTALISLIFLLSYAAAQFIAGAKAIHVLLDWPLWSGTILGAVIVLGYCLAGGIRASIWTDAAQSLVMILAMGFIFYVAIDSVGGLSDVYSKLESIEGYLSFSDIAGLHMLLFFGAWLIAGFSVIAQPHIMVRFMSLNDPNNLIWARCWYYVWFVIFYLMATAVGLLARIYFPVETGFDPELALPKMALELLPPVATGLVLAGIFAATISTADSLILSCSSCLSQDLLPVIFAGKRKYLWATFLCVLLALLWSFINSESVFALVVLSWGMLAVTFVPLIFAALLKLKMSTHFAIGLVIVNGLTTWLIAKYAVLGDLFVAAPVIVLSLICMLLIRWKKSVEVLHE